MLGGGGKKTDKTLASNQQTLSVFFTTTGDSELAATKRGLRWNILNAQLSWLNYHGLMLFYHNSEKGRAESWSKSQLGRKEKTSSIVFRSCGQSGSRNCRWKCQKSRKKESSKRWLISTYRLNAFVMLSAAAKATTPEDELSPEAAAEATAETEAKKAKQAAYMQAYRGD
jgi:hypothetical protein